MKKIRKSDNTKKDKSTEIIQVNGFHYFLMNIKVYHYKGVFNHTFHHFIEGLLTPLWPLRNTLSFFYLILEH